MNDNGKINYVNEKAMQNFYKARQSKKNKYKLRRASCILITGGILLSSIILIAKYNKTPNYNTTYSYIQLMNDNSDDLIYDKLEIESKEIYELLNYINISEKLHNLNLDKYNVPPKDSIELLECDDIELLINKYNVVKNDINYRDNVISLLKNQEALVNQRVFKGYYDVPDYLLMIAKIKLSEKYQLDPNKITLTNIKFEKGDGIFNCNLNYDGTSRRIYSNIDNEVSIVVTAANLQQNQNNKDIIVQQTYNNDRNNLIRNSIYSVSNNIKSIYDDFTKNNIK